MPVPAASVILPCYNGLPYVRRCVASLRRHTPTPHELIVVDNGSARPTRRYLRSLKGIRLIANRRNLGFAKAVNQGMRAARGSHLVWLNSDAVVTPGWLEGLLGHLRGDPRIGVVAPMTDGSVVAAQRLRSSVPDPGVLPRFAAAWSLRHRGRRAWAPWVVGFCLLLRREAMETVGELDESFGLGPMEDRDYCLRLRLAGFRIAVARDVFVRHEYHKTFFDMFSREEVRRMTDAAVERFLLKWERLRPPLRPLLDVWSPPP